MTIEFMLVKSAKNPLGTPQKAETFEDFARIVQNARNAIGQPLISTAESNKSKTPRARSIRRREPIA